MSDTPLAIVAALDDEIRIIKSRMDVDSRVHIRPAMFTRGKYNEKPILLLRSGLGFGAMKRSIEYLIEHYHPGFCLHVGYCGGCDPRYGAGDLIVADAVINERTGERHEIEGDMVERAVRICRQKELRSGTGTLLTVGGTVQVHSPHEKAFVGTKHGAIGVDMESAAFVNVCTSKNMKCLVVRAILDPLDLTLPQFGKTMDRTGEIDGLALTENIIRNPKNLIKLPRIGYCAMQARQAITAFVNAWMETTI